jgi:hypothetical protein
MVPLMEDLDLVRAIKTRGRLVRVPLPVVTSARRYRAGGVLSTMLRHWIALIAWRLARRYREGGVLSTMLRHWMALIAWRLGIDRQRVARWVAR